MKIFVDGVIFSRQQRGGISRTYSELLPRMSAIDPTIECVVYLRRKLKKGPLPMGPRVKHILERSIYPWRFLVGKASAQRSLMQRVYEAERPDIFHTTYFTRPRTPRSKYVLPIYDMIDEKFVRTAQLNSCREVVKQKRDCVQFADLIISNSKWTTDDLLEYFKLSPDRVVTIPLGVGPEFAPILDEEKKTDFCARYGLVRPFLLYVGGKRFNKNVMGLLKGYAGLKVNKDVDLVFVGDDDDFGVTEKEFIASSMRGGAVRNLGILSQQELVLAYNCGLALVFPSLHEGFGLPLLEAMACGMPVAASNATSLPEVGGDAVLYFDPNDSADLAHALERIVCPGTRERLVEKGKARVKMFTWENTAKRTLEAYRKLI